MRTKKAISVSPAAVEIAERVYPKHPFSHRSAAKVLLVVVFDKERISVENLEEETGYSRDVLKRTLFGINIRLESAGIGIRIEERDGFFEKVPVASNG